ncbi:MAG: chalcone isomerase family protein [Pseudomonadota bacterium]|nr:chalcone isomerase family protein [Pseudomonadota bacterium]
MAQQAAPPAASASEQVAVQAFPPTIFLGEEPLKINGRGVRERLFVKVYEMVLYTPSGSVGSMDELAKGDKPFRLRFQALRNIEGAGLGRILIDGMTKNAKPELQATVLKHTNGIVEVFSTQASLAKGQTFHIDYMPGKGTTFYIAETPRGKAVEGAEFAELILGVWLGQHPASDALKAKLLGK